MVMQTRAPQKRRVATRQKLIDAARQIVAKNGFAGLRVEDVVEQAGVAKGTFFSHFEDKDRLMALLIGTQMEQILSQIAAGPPPADIDDFSVRFAPLMNFMAQDRIVFDIVVRFSGAAAIETNDLISLNFGHQVDLLAIWIKELQGDVIRDDVDAVLLAEGFQAFAIQAIALKFCALHNAGTIQDRLTPYLKAWLSRPS